MADFQIRGALAVVTIPKVGKACGLGSPRHLGFIKQRYWVAVAGRAISAAIHKILI
jgi:hypothetical protein